MIGKWMKSLGGKGAKETLPTVGEAALGRVLRIDPSMLVALNGALGEETSSDFLISAQGRIDLSDESGTSWLHRFYDDDDRMLQAMTTSKGGGYAEEWSFYVPSSSEHLATGASTAEWGKRLTRATMDYDGTAFDRLWYEGDDRDQPAVKFEETVFESADMSDPRAIPQECMVYGTESAQGEVLLLALIQGMGSEATFETMLGTGLHPHQLSI